MPRQAARPDRSLASQTLVLDNGAYTIKAGFAGPSADASQCLSIPNCIAKSRDKRIWIASQLHACKNFAEMAFRRPVERGYVVNWEGEKAVWEHSFFDNDAELKCDPQGTNLVLTEAPNCPHALQMNCDQMVFEEFGFASYYRCLAPSLNAYNDIPSLFNETAGSPSMYQLPVECLLLVDSGYSHTTVTPLIRGQPVQQAIRRLDVGGKLMSNYLKELLSVRHVALTDEPYLVNEIKEAACFVSDDFRRDLERTWKGGVRDRREVDASVVVDYVLPDHDTRHHGEIRPHDPLQAARMKRLGAASGSKEYALPLGNERFAVPELLFNPSDVGLKEAGLPEVIMQSLATLPTGLWPAMLANIVLVGGNAKIPGLVERLKAELRRIAPAEYAVRIGCPVDPITYTWLGGARMASDRDRLKNFVVTRQEYQENGPNWLARQFTPGSK